MTFVDKVRLAKHVLASHFGSTVEVVGVALIRRGPSPLSFLVHDTGLVVRLVKESLFVLIHHNLVQYRDISNDDDASSFQGIVYRLDWMQLLIRLAFPSLIVKVRDEMGLEAAELLQQVIYEGRLSVEKINMETGILERLLQFGLIEYVTDASSEYEEILIGDKIAQITSSSPAHSKRTPASTLNPSPKKIRSTNAPNIGEAAELKKFIRLRMNAVKDYFLTMKVILSATLEINQAVGEIIRCVGNSSAHTTSLEERSSWTFTPYQISSNLNHNISLLVDTLSLEEEEEKKKNTKTPIMHYLEIMEQDLSYVYQDDVRAGGTFRVDWLEARKHVCYNMIESFIKDRFGLASLRIFRIIKTKKMVEERTISRVALISPKECRERLYQLLQNGLVTLQEVPKTIDHAPSRTFYLWTIKITELMDTMASWHLHTIINVWERILLERNNNALLISKSERSDVRANSALLTTVEQAQLQELRHRLDRLYFHLHRTAADNILFIDDFK